MRSTQTRQSVDSNIEENLEITRAVETGTWVTINLLVTEADCLIDIAGSAIKPNRTYVMMLPALARYKFKPFPKTPSGTLDHR